MTWNTQLPLVAILRGICPNEVLAHMAVLIDAGFDLIELPTNSPNWQDSLALAMKHFGDRAMIGAGTVVTLDHVDDLAALGAKLAVAPNCNPAVIRHAIQAGMTMCPGIATATEAFSAIEAGAQTLKVFPAQVLGPSFVQALKAVLPPTVDLLAVGGITPANLSLYLQAGCLGAGLGGDLYKAGQPPDRTRDQAQAFVAAYRNATATQKVAGH